MTGACVADPDGALSLATNPAGLAGSRGYDTRLLIDVGAQRFGNTSNSLTTLGPSWGAFASLPLGPVALAGSLERASVPGEGLPWYGRTRASWGIAAQLFERLSLGAAMRWQNTTSGQWYAWDAGLLLRPWSWLSLGGRLSGLHSDTAMLAADAPLTRWTLGAAVRPTASDRLTLRFDWEAPDTLGHRAWTGGIGLRVVDGLQLLATYRDALVGSDAAALGHDQTIGVALSLGFGRHGVDLSSRSMTFPDADRRMGLTLGLRRSGDQGPSMADPSPAAISVRIDGPLRETADGDGVHFAQLLMTLSSLSRRPAVQVVVLQVSQFSASWAQVEELRIVLQELHHQGKKLIWYSTELGSRALALASSCDRIVLPASGMVSARGLQADFMSIQPLLAQLGVGMETIRFGAHKTAPESLDRPEPSAELAEQIQHSLDHQWRVFVDAVALGRALTTTAVEQALDRGVVFPQDALEAHLIDAVVPTPDLEPLLRQWQFLGDGDHLQAWTPLPSRRRAWGAVPRLRVIEVAGNISDFGGFSPLGSTLSGVQLANTIRQSASDSSVKGLVVRIDSPGGSVHGSDAMMQALVKARETKPVVASMGSVAASGGYWTSLGSSLVFADRTTITGSIGIFTVKPAMAGLLSKIGISVKHFGIGPHEDAQGSIRPWTPSDHKAIELSLARYYGLFLDNTAQARSLPRQAMLHLAEGRIWFGDEAVANHLVDRLGGLLPAMDAARQQAGIGIDDDYMVDFAPRAGLLVRISASAGVALGLAQAGPRNLLADSFGLLQQALVPWLDAEALAYCLQAHGPQAFWPAVVDRQGP